MTMQAQAIGLTGWRDVTRCLCMNSVRLFSSVVIDCGAVVLMGSILTRSLMSTIPVSLTEDQFTTHIKPHLSVAKRGFESEQPQDL